MTMEPEIDYLEKLALQLAGLAQIRDWVGGAAGWPFWLSLALLAAAALATLAALVFLAQSIWPARFRYVTSELELHTYLETVRTTAAASGSSADQATQAAVLAARTVMVQQYAIGASSNRLINQGRANRRTRAGLATLASVFAVLVLVGLVVVSNLHGHGTASSARQDGARSRDAVEFGPASPEPGAAAAHAGSVQGLVERPHDDAPSGGPGAERP